MGGVTILHEYRMILSCCAHVAGECMEWDAMGGKCIVIYNFKYSCNAGASASLADV